MIKKILIGLVAIIAVILVLAAIKSPHYEISREITINAPAEKIFSHLNNSQKMNAWMPWKDADPTVEYKYPEPAEGVGSVCSWDSQGRMGTGSSTIIESVPNRLVKTRIDYVKPFTMTQISDMTLTPSADGLTTVMRWSVSGENVFVGRIMCLFSNMEKMIGPEFEKGLAKLKSTAEGS